MHHESCKKMRGENCGVVSCKSGNCESNFLYESFQHKLIKISNVEKALKMKCFHVPEMEKCTSLYWFSTVMMNFPLNFIDIEIKNSSSSSQLSSRLSCLFYHGKISSNVGHSIALCTMISIMLPFDNQLPWTRFQFLSIPRFYGRKNRRKLRNCR